MCSMTSMPKCIFCAKPFHSGSEEVSSALGICLEKVNQSKESIPEIVRTEVCAEVYTAHTDLSFPISTITRQIRQNHLISLWAPESPTPVTFYILVLNTAG